MEKETERLYELIRLEEKKLEVQTLLDEALNKKLKMEEKRRKRIQWGIRACQFLIALCLSIVGAVTLAINPIIQLFIGLVLLLLFNFLFGMVFTIFKWLRLGKIFSLLKRLYKRDKLPSRSRYNKKLEKENRKIEKFKKDLDVHVEKINQKAAFLPSYCHNLEGFQSLYDYLHFGQADKLESALFLYEQRFRHEEHMKVLKELQFEQLQANQKIRELDSTIDKLKKEVDHLKKKDKS